jgi:hypothetical protein
MSDVKRTTLIAVLALLLTACATGGPAATGARTRCAEDSPGETMRPLVFLFCAQSP